MAAAAGVLGIVLAAVGGALLLTGSASGSTDERKQVLARASDFAVAYNTYDVADLADYQKRLGDLLSPKYKAQFVKVTDAIFTAIKDKKQTSGDAKVLATAVDSIDKDSSDVLVAVDASISNTDNKAAVQRHFRWVVSFEKIKGEWLVANFESVAPVTAETSTPGTPTPTPTATDGGAK
ncbi:hypothetical protein [Aeromicrobium sp.]|uniref:hypothetical protein n=1 Tax=Aeromicrobium sp. TaxID=1871063 RepID=UPI003C35F4BB